MVYCVAAPVRDREGRILAALGALVPVNRAGRLDDLVDPVRDAAGLIGAGGRRSGGGAGMIVEASPRGSTALVTGAGSGIGQATVVALARDGWATMSADVAAPAASSSTPHQRPPCGRAPASARKR